MVTATIIIGANYGDEAKGQTVHDLSDRNTCVVRFNGGAQAGHTVMHHGDRNVFHQLGSGTYRGAATYLGPECIVNPSVYLMEKNKFPTATMCIDRRARVTTFTDVIINRLRERDLGANRHGSCGMGINETVRRHEIVPLTVNDINNPYFDAQIHNIWKQYGPSRLIELNLDHLVDAYFEELTEKMIEESIFEMKYMYDTCIKVNTINDLVSMFDSLVFEGAQGLMLSERNMQWFPHLTRSDTGITNAMAILTEIEYGTPITSIDVVYVTRPYTTRHGAGPLECEWNHIPYSKFEDLTNVPNDWQGTMRTAPLNIDLMANQIFDDIDRCEYYVVNGHVQINCWDQVCDEDVVYYIEDGCLTSGTPKELVEAVQAQLPFMKVTTKGMF